MYTLDTNAIIYYLKDDPVAVPILSPIFADIVPVYVSAITEVELFGFPALAAEESVRIEAILQTVAVLALDSPIARTAGMLPIIRPEDSRQRHRGHRPIHQHDTPHPQRQRFQESQWSSSPQDLKVSREGSSFILIVYLTRNIQQS